MNPGEILEAARRIRPHVVRTPLFRVPTNRYPGQLREPGQLRDDVELFLKLECEQISGSFKARGANHFVERLVESGFDSGLVTYSSGNHGRAVAEAARRRGIPSVVTVPDHVDPSKAAAIEAAGAELVRAGPTSESRRVAAERIAAERGYAIVPPFDHEWIIAGQGTVGLEILEDVVSMSQELAGVWVPVGGGGLAAGIALAVRSARPDVVITLVEPARAASMNAALAAGERVSIDRPESVADGLLPQIVGARNFEILRNLGVRSVTVDEETILASLRLLRGDLGIPAEPSAAVAAAPLLFPDRVSAGRDAPAGTHVAIVSGGNVSAERLERLL